MKNKNFYFGRDEFYNSVIIENDNNLVGKIENVKIKDYNQNTLFGEIISQTKRREFAA